ncbi:hypothetical protein IJG04_00830 [Candidatus Saccharibacteria bacterium]|nr:hypothetical protein [Candidatus Saccharibacteria bacterium]
MATPVSPTFATISYNGMKMWDTSEMITIDNEVEDLLSEICDGRAGECDDISNAERQELYQSLIDEDTGYRNFGKYSALDTFRSRRFWITSIELTPETEDGNGGESLMVYYRDTDPDLAREGVYEYVGDMDELYIVWAEDEESNPYYGEREADNSPKYVTHLRDSGVIPSDMKIHQTVSYSNIRNGVGWYGVPNTEKYFYVLGSGLFNDELRTIHYYFKINEDLQLTDFSNYSSCTDMLSEDEPLEGIECRLMFTEDSTAIYMPFRDGVMLYTDIEEPDDINNPDNQNIDSSDNINDNDDFGDNINGDDGFGNDSNSSSNNVDDGNTDENSSDTIDAESNFTDTKSNVATSNTPKTPDTGSANINNGEFRPKTTELIATIATLGVILTIWLSSPRLRVFTKI